MTGDRIRYRRGYRYQLVNDYRVQTGILPDYDIETEFVQLDRSGLLTIRHGYAWDGPSDPFVLMFPYFIRKRLLRTFMRGSLTHDALAGLMRDVYLDRDKWFTPVNRELQKICIEDGMSHIRADLVFTGVEHLGGRSWVQWGDGGKPLCEAP
jgi:hypothetical protein